MIKTIFHHLEGFWQFCRTVPNGSVIGTARFTKQGSEELYYREEGRMTFLNGSSHRVYREYVYKLEKGVISVFFYEKPLRLFHHLEVADASDYPITARGVHLCGCDQYDAIYQFEGPDKFSLKYLIQGPKKDYSIFTIFEKNDSLKGFDP